jgi:hypothetical protein
MGRSKPVDLATRSFVKQVQPVSELKGGGLQLGKGCPLFELLTPKQTDRYRPILLIIGSVDGSGGMADVDSIADI